MDSANQDKNKTLTVEIKGSLSAYQVSDLKQQMLAGLKNHDGLVLNVDGVTECDTLGIQLIYSAGKTAGKMNKTFLVTGKSEVCWEAALGIGLEPEDYLNSVEET